jgi:hypothetical protein
MVRERNQKTKIRANWVTAEAWYITHAASSAEWEVVLHQRIQTQLASADHAGHFVQRHTPDNTLVNGSMEEKPVPQRKKVPQVLEGTP